MVDFIKSLSNGARTTLPDWSGSNIFTCNGGAAGRFHQQATLNFPRRRSRLITADEFVLPQSFKTPATSP